MLRAVAKNCLGFHLNVALSWLINGGTDHLPPHGALHSGYFFRACFNEEDHQPGLGMGGGDAVGHGLQEHRLACPRRRHNAAALPLARRA
jgi:hypothetical protein